MSQTVDANPLLYAANRSAPEHERALLLVEFLARGPDLVVLFWPVVMAYLRIATHPAVFPEPLSHSQAAANIEALMARPHVRVAGPGERFWELYRQVAHDVPPRGNDVPDAQIATLMLEHGVGVLWSRDRDFRKYRGITVRDPFNTKYGSGFG